jgi:UV DNA damage repair endonuclease
MKGVIMPQTSTPTMYLSEKALHQIVEALSKSVKPRVLYHQDQQRMTEEALDICQKNARAVLKVVHESLPADHWLASEIMVVLDEAVELWDRYPL